MAPLGEATNFSPRNFSVFYLYHPAITVTDYLFFTKLCFFSWKKPCRFSYQITLIHIGMFSKLQEHSLHEASAAIFTRNMTGYQ